jgi:hypothetical protein
MQMKQEEHCYLSFSSVCYSLGQTRNPADNGRIGRRSQNRLALGIIGKRIAGSASVIFAQV